MNPDKCECCGTTKNVRFCIGANVDLCRKCSKALWKAEQEEAQHES